MFNYLQFISFLIDNIINGLIYDDDHDSTFTYSNEWFGYSVDISNETAIVGAVFANNYYGAAS